MAERPASPSALDEESLRAALQDQEDTLQHQQEEDTEPHEQQQEDVQRHRIEPPPQTEYKSLDELKAAVAAWTREHGFELVIDCSQKQKNGSIRKIVHCGRAGKTQNSRKITDATRVRKTTSRKDGCPMGLQYIYDGKTWRVQHSRKEKSIWHNHAPLPANTAAPSQRRRDKTEAVTIMLDAHHAAGVSVKQSLAAIKEKFAGSSLTAKDISNHRHRTRRLQQQILDDASLHWPLGSTKPPQRTQESPQHTYDPMPVHPPQQPPFAPGFAPPYYA